LDAKNVTVTTKQANSDDEILEKNIKELMRG